MDFQKVLDKLDNVKKDWILSDFVNYVPLIKLGSGQYGDVYKMIEKKTGKEYAIKMISLNDDVIPFIENEIVHTALLGSNVSGCLYICPMHGIFRENDTICIVSNDCGTSLKTHLHNPLELKLKWFKQLLIAVKCCHDRKIIHCDINPNNILINNNNISLIDFGLSQFMDDNEFKMSETRIGTPLYMSPHMVRQYLIVYGNDIWACGCILWEMITGKRLFDEKKSYDVYPRIISEPIPFELIPEKYRELVMGLLNKNMDDIFTIDEALESFDNII